MPGGYRIETRTATATFDTARFGLKWDGEWQITYEVFRDLGLAFAVVLVLITFSSSAGSRASRCRS